jgi:hypothetical protein
VNILYLQKDTSSNLQFAYSVDPSYFVNIIDISTTSKHTLLHDDDVREVSDWYVGEDIVAWESASYKERLFVIDNSLLSNIETLLKACYKIEIVSHNDDQGRTFLEMCKR